MENDPSILKQSIINRRINSATIKEGKENLIKKRPSTTKLDLVTFLSFRKKSSRKASNSLKSLKNSLLKTPNSGKNIKRFNQPNPHDKHSSPWFKPS
jgi:hypothetical protein